MPFPSAELSIFERLLCGSTFHPALFRCLFLFKYFSIHFSFFAIRQKVNFVLINLVHMQIIRSIQNRIYEIRGERVMLDKDLADLYETETKALNLAVKRNIARFPADFMFQLTKEEFDGLRFQIETLEKDNSLRLQIETSKGRGGTRYLPYAFTEQGVAMLSGLHNKAIMNIAITEPFVK